MIIKNEREQWVGCSLCGERIELSQADATNPLTVLIHLQQMRIEHKPCEQYSLDPAKARLERIYRVGMRAELAAFAALPVEALGTLSISNAPSY